jgi:hypothetical protein
VPDDGSSNILRFSQLLLGFGFGVALPCNVEIVVATLDLLASEATPAACLALILALCPAGI